MQQFAQIDRAAFRLRVDFLFGNLADKLQSRDPAVRAFAVFGTSSSVKSKSSRVMTSAADCERRRMIASGGRSRVVMIRWIISDEYCKRRSTSL